MNRRDIQTVYVPAGELAKELGSDLVSNMVTLGALIANLPVVEIRSLIMVMDSLFSKNQSLLEMNKNPW